MASRICAESLSTEWSKIDRSVFEFVVQDLDSKSQGQLDFIYQSTSSKTYRTTAEPGFSIVISPSLTGLSPTPGLDNLQKAIDDTELGGSDFDAEKASGPVALLTAQVSAPITKSEPPTIKSVNSGHPSTRLTHFVSALDKFNEVIPNDDARERFQAEPQWCLANKKGTLVRCRWSMPFEIRSEVAQLLPELAQLDVNRDRKRCLSKLIEFTSIAVCRWQRDSTIGKLKMLLREDNLKSCTSLTESVSVTASKMFAPAETSLPTLTCPGDKVTTASIQNRVTDDWLENIPFKVAYWLRESSTWGLHYIPQNRPYDETPSSPTLIQERVVAQAMEPLFCKFRQTRATFNELDERDDGYIYVYWNRASFGLLKIGCTTRSVDVRLAEWEDQCKHVAEEHYRSPFRVKHVARLEKLIHTEFSANRVVEPYCHGCERKHIEWFRGLNLRMVIDRIKFWTDWIMKGPYEERLGLWQLKTGPEFELLEGCTTFENTKGSSKAETFKESVRYRLRSRQVSEKSRTPRPRNRCGRSTGQVDLRAPQIQLSP